MTQAAAENTIINVKVKDIRVDAHRLAAVEGDTIVDLAASIAEIGLLNPITVTEGKGGQYKLVAGARRYLAVKELGWEEVTVNVVTLSKLHREMAEIDENLQRQAMSILDRGDALARRKEIYEALHPETKHGKATGTGPESKGHATESKTEPRSTLPTASRSKPRRKKSFADDVAAKTGVTPRAVREEVQISKLVGPEVRKIIAGTPVTDSKTDLRTIARAKPERREEIARELVATHDRRNRASAKQPKRRPRRDSRLCAKCQNCKRSPLTAEEIKAGHKHLVRCSAGYFEETEPASLPVDWDPVTKLCPDFDPAYEGALSDARKIDDPDDDTRSSRHKGQYLNLGDAFDLETLAAMRHLIREVLNDPDWDGGMVNFPSVGDKIDRLEFDATILEMLVDKVTINKTAKAADTSRLRVRDAIRRMQDIAPAVMADTARASRLAASMIGKPIEEGEEG